MTNYDLNRVKIMKERKGVETVNKFNFLQNFDISQLKDFENKRDFFDLFKHKPFLKAKGFEYYQPDVNETTVTQEYREDYWVVDSFQCIGSAFSPECLYNFTNKIRLVDQIVYRTADITSLVKDEYFYTEE